MVAGAAPDISLTVACRAAVTFSLTISLASRSPAAPPSDNRMARNQTACWASKASIENWKNRLTISAVLARVTPNYSDLTAWVPLLLGWPRERHRLSRLSLLDITSRRQSISRLHMKRLSLPLHVAATEVEAYEDGQNHCRDQGRRHKGRVTWILLRRKAVSHRIYSGPPRHRRNADLTWAFRAMANPSTGNAERLLAFRSCRDCRSITQ